jgi:hypothetical protein
MRTFTLDTNCLLAVDEGRPEASAVQALVDAHRDGRASVALSAITASERQRDGAMLDNFALFQERVKKLGFDHLELLLPMGYWNVMFWDACVEGDAAMADLERKIQAILFPSVPVDWAGYCVVHGFDPSTTKLDRRWKNVKCDVQAFWCHTWNKRSVFVTTDGKFHAATKKPRLLALAPGAIERPDAAVMLI